MKKLNSEWHKDVSSKVQSRYEDYIKVNNNITIDGSKAADHNIEDFLAYIMSYQAMKFETQNSEKTPIRLPGLYYSPEQLFWILSAQKYCHVNKDQFAYHKIVSSEFPIESYRVNSLSADNFHFMNDFNCSKSET